MERIQPKTREELEQDDWKFKTSFVPDVSAVNRIYPCEIQIQFQEKDKIRLRFAGIPDAADLSEYDVRFFRLVSNQTSKRFTEDGTPYRNKKYGWSHPTHLTSAPWGDPAGDYSRIPYVTGRIRTITDDYPGYTIYPEEIFYTIISKFSFDNNVESNLRVFQDDFEMNWPALISWMVYASRYDGIYFPRIHVGSRVKIGVNHIRTGGYAHFYKIRGFGFALFKNGVQVSDIAQFNMNVTTGNIELATDTSYAIIDLYVSATPV